jgi:hypothetical protein
MPTPPLAFATPGQRPHLFDVVRQVALACFGQDRPVVASALDR